MTRKEGKVKNQGKQVIIFLDISLNDTKPLVSISTKN